MRLFSSGVSLGSHSKLSPHEGTNPRVGECGSHGFAGFGGSTKPKIGIHPFEQKGREVCPKHDLSHVAHRHPRSSAYRTAASISLFGCLGLATNVSLQAPVEKCQQSVGAIFSFHSPENLAAGVAG